MEWAALSESTVLPAWVRSPPKLWLSRSLRVSCRRSVGNPLLRSTTVPLSVAVSVSPVLFTSASVVKTLRVRDAASEMGRSESDRSPTLSP